MPNGMAATMRDAVLTEDVTEKELEKTPWSKTGFVGVIEINLRSVTGTVVYNQSPDRCTDRCTGRCLPVLQKNTSRRRKHTKPKRTGHRAHPLTAAERAKVASRRRRPSRQQKDAGLKGAKTIQRAKDEDRQKVLYDAWCERLD